LDFWGYAVVAAGFLGVIDWIILRPAEPLVTATILLGEVTAFLAAATYYSGVQQRGTNMRLEGIVSRWLEIEEQQMRGPDDEADDE
jgi:hypothetical protein